MTRGAVDSTGHNGEVCLEGDAKSPQGAVGGISLFQKEGRRRGTGRCSPRNHSSFGGMESTRKRKRGPGGGVQQQT